MNALHPAATTTASQDACPTASKPKDDDSSSSVTCITTASSTSSPASPPGSPRTIQQQLQHLQLQQIQLQSLQLQQLIQQQQKLQQSIRELERQQQQQQQQQQQRRRRQQQLQERTSDADAVEPAPSAYESQRVRLTLPEALEHPIYRIQQQRQQREYLVEGEGELQQQQLASQQLASQQQPLSSQGCDDHEEQPYLVVATLVSSPVEVDVEAQPQSTPNEDHVPHGSSFVQPQPSPSSTSGEFDSHVSFHDEEQQAGGDAITATCASVRLSGAQSHETTTTTTTTTTTPTTVIVQAKPARLGDAIRDLMGHGKGRLCLVAFCVLIMLFAGSLTWAVNMSQHRHEYQDQQEEQRVQQESEKGNFWDGVGAQPEPVLMMAPPVESEHDDIGNTDDYNVVNASMVPMMEEHVTMPFSSILSPSVEPTSSPTSELEGHILGLLPNYTKEALVDPMSPQSKALRWLLQSMGIPQEFDPSLVVTSRFMEPNVTDDEVGANITAATSPRSQYLYYSDARLLQRFVLATFYYATGGGGWRFNRLWLSTSLDVHECDWWSYWQHPTMAGAVSMQTDYASLVCNDEGEYTQLWLADNFLRGTLPKELSLLSRLEDLTIPNDNFKADAADLLGSTIPSEMGLLTSLQRLDISKNFLVGRLPPELGNCLSLQYLRLLENNLSGDLPTAWGALPQLQEVYLYNNNLRSTLPTEYGNLTSLKVLSLHSNKLHGTLPVELSLMTSLKRLELHFNMLHGSIPSEIGLLSDNLTRFQVNNNALTSTIPTELGNLSLLYWFLVNANEITGTIPVELGNFRLATYFLLSDNALSGTVPESLGNLKNLQYMQLQDNLLTGSIPTQVCHSKSNNLLFIWLQVDCSEVQCGCSCVCW